MIEVIMDSIGINPSTHQRIAILKEQTGERYFPILIGSAEADAITLKIQGVDVPRPLSHDLLRSVINSLGASVDCVVIDELKGDTLYAKIILDIGEAQIDVDARPSDALTLAVGAGMPIFINDILLDRFGFFLDKKTGRAIPQEKSKEKPASEDELKKLSAYTDFINTLDIDDFGKSPREDDNG